jgi:2-iminoacetate synthase
MSTKPCTPRADGPVILHRGDEHERHLREGKDFIECADIPELLRRAHHPSPSRVHEIIRRSLALQRLEPDEAASLLMVEDPELWREIFAAAREVKDRVYGPRVVTFAPLYLSNHCVNSCLYCGFRRENVHQERRQLTLTEVREEVAALVGCGHKRLIVVYGEHPRSDIDYMTSTIETIYATRIGNGEIRRVNVNAAPLTIGDYGRLREVGIGTYQVFQETYHRATYHRVHPRGPKADYRWRLYALHRAQEAGIDDVAIGALFGLYDWRYEVLGLLLHAIDLERCFAGIGPHTISFPRLEPAAEAPWQPQSSPHRVSDESFLKLVAVLRLAVPYTGLIVTARESAQHRRQALQLGCTQTDASSRIGIGDYSRCAGQRVPGSLARGPNASRPQNESQEIGHQQFLLSDLRELDEMVGELAEMGLLTSFCTAGYRCGRTGSRFMDLARQGKVREFCLPNAILTLKEYLVDYASPRTRAVGEQLIERHLATIAPPVAQKLREWLVLIEKGTRDLRL